MTLPFRCAAPVKFAPPAIIKFSRQLRSFQRRPEWAVKYNGREVLIRSREHGAWWRTNACGYSLELSGAGVYLFEDALDRTNHCGPEKKIQFDFIARVAAP